MERRRSDDSGRGRDREDDRGGRGRDREDDRRGSRDDDRGGRGRDDDRRASSRDDDRGSRGSREDDRRGGGRSSGSGSAYRYEARSAEDTKKRASMGANDFDKIVKDHIKMWKPNDGDNRIRLLPPTWAKAKHYGYDVFVHYGVGPDRQSYLDLQKMQGEPDPITEERERARRERDPDEKYIKDLDSKRRVGVYLIDRDNEREGVQFWAMPWTVDRDITTVSVDREGGGVLPIDDPEDGYDILFTKKGQKDRTEYTGIQVARRESRLGNAEWLDFAVDNPIPDQLLFFPYDHIAKAFGAVGEGREKDRGRDDDRTDDRKGGRDDDAPRGRDRDARGSRDDRGGAKLDWDGVHAMTMRELEDLVENERLSKVDPREAKDEDDLADWICDEMGIKKAQERTRGRDDDRTDDRKGGRDDDAPRRRQVDDDDDAPTRRKVDDDAPARRRVDDDGDDKLARMRERRERDR
ncbi:hypothetical protein D3C87_973750 [compost metagenome]